MDFFINKHSTLPRIQMELIKDGRNDFNKFHEMIQNSNITFCMTEVETGKRIVGNKNAICILKQTDDDCVEEEYYIGYQFSAKETKKAGDFIGEFTLTFLDGSGKLIVPIISELNIHILEGSIKK